MGLITGLLGFGCSTLSYYSQAIGGQVRLLHQRQPIQQLLNDHDTDPALKEQLQAVTQMREFATRELDLPDNGSYSSYAATGRTAVVWNVVATPSWSLTPKQWCFPVVGCVPYRGYFDHDKAVTFAAKLQQRDLEVAVIPATAYSTLGWFDDPVLDTMFAYPASPFAGPLFHELAHQKLYLKNDAEFNESFASAVEIIGLRRWLEQTQETGQLEKWQQQRQREHQVNTLLGATSQA